MIQRLLLLFLPLLALSACQSDHSRQLPGSWTAYSVTQDGDSLQINPAEVRFIFHEDGTYEFFSTLNYREAGRYEVENGLLFTTDTLAADSDRKKVLIRMPDSDSLRIEMREGNIPRTISLVRNE